MKRIALILTLVALTGCTDETAARNALEGSGFKDIKLTGYSYFGCDKNDTFHTGFEARGPSGQFVEGVVCSGWMKGATVRFN
jgi:predicted small secreted protein